MPVRKKTRVSNAKIGKARSKVKAKAARSSNTKPAEAPGTIWNGIGSDAVARATGKSWDQWFALLDKDGVSTIPHKEIALHLREKYGVGDWWCQMITVGYEQARGLRVRHQTATGFVANLSKTLPVTMAAAFKAVNDGKSRAKWLDEAVTITKATPNKTIRMVMNDGSRVVVGLWDKTGKGGEAKTQVVFQHEKLRSLSDVARSKATWRIAVDALAQVLKS